MSGTDETLEGWQRKTSDGKKKEFKDGILYTNMGGKKGECYYQRLDQRVRFFFEDNKVRELYVVSSLYETLMYASDGKSPSR